MLIETSQRDLPDVPAAIEHGADVHCEDPVDGTPLRREPERLHTFAKYCRSRRGLYAGG